MEMTNKQHQDQVASSFAFDDDQINVNLINGSDTIIKRGLALGTNVCLDQTNNLIGPVDNGSSPYDQQDQAHLEHQHHQYNQQQYQDQEHQPRFQPDNYLINEHQIVQTNINNDELEIEQLQQHNDNELQAQYHQDQDITNGHNQFYTDCNQSHQQPQHQRQQQAQFIQQQQQLQIQYNNNQDKLYTDLDNHQHHNQQNRVRFLNTTCEPISSTTTNQFNNIRTVQLQPQSGPAHQTIGQNNIINNNESYMNNQQRQHQHQQQSQLITNNQQQHHHHQVRLNNQIATADTTSSMRPHVEIVEQPARCALRFRYKCEGRSAGSLPGASSTIDNKTFPSIRINNYRGRAVVVISTVTRDEPYKAHPHNIVGREGCKKGICTIVIKSNEPTNVRSFPSLGIQCVKRRDIEESLALRESIHVDPFREGFEHKQNSSNIDLNAVRLCFQVFIEGSHPGKCDVPLMPVVSNPIHDKKAMSDLVITKLSHCSAPATGGREVILLCDRITKEDIKIRFFEERNGRVYWEDFYEPTAADIHKQVAICFKTPKYHNENIQAPVMVRIQLKRISDNQVSESRPFQFLPCESDEDIIHRKRQKIDWVNPERYALR